VPKAGGDRSSRTLAKKNMTATWTTADTLTSLNVCLTFIYCILTGLIVIAATKQVEAINRPYLFFGLEFHGMIVEAVLKNTGKSPALSVELTINPALQTHIRGESRPAVLPKTKGFTVPAESESREFLGSWQEICAAEGSLIFSVTLAYKSTTGKQYTETMQISFEHNRDRAYLGRKTSEQSLSEIAVALQTLVKEKQTISQA